MKIGFHHRKGSYSEHWIKYCLENNINFKVVNAYSTDIINDLQDCVIFMWHHHQGNPKDALFAKQLLFSLESEGKIVYPDFYTGWHFDDKLGQKYLLESIGAPLVPTYIFYDKQEALNWTEETNFPKVFKLRGGAGSANVRLIKSRNEAFTIIKQAFGKGFRQYNPMEIIKDSFRKFRNEDKNLIKLIKSSAHFLYPYQIEKSKGREKGYVYFQDFIPDCKYDIRVQLIGNKCYAMKRYVRPNDFRASGGGNIDYDGSKIPLSAIKLSFDVAKILKMQTMAIDLLPFKDSYLIAEISYAFAIDDGELDPGYWDSSFSWHPGLINPFGWMIEDLIEKFKNSLTGR